MELYEILLNNDFPFDRLSKTKTENLKLISYYISRLPQDKFESKLEMLENYINLTDEESTSLAKDFRLFSLFESQESESDKSKNNKKTTPDVFPLRKSKSEFWMTKREAVGNPNYVGSRAIVVADKPRWLNIYSSRALIYPKQTATTIGAPSSVSASNTTESIYNFLKDIDLPLFKEAFPNIKSEGTYSLKKAIVTLDDKSKINVEYPLIQIEPSDEIKVFYSNIWISLFIQVGIGIGALDQSKIRLSYKADDRPVSDIVVDERGIIKISCYSDLQTQLQGKATTDD